MADDMQRLEYLDGVLYNFHPGSHVGQGAEEGIRLITEVINKVVKPGHKTTILLETMAGKGTEVGGRFEELKKIIDGVDDGIKIGVCMDTCHIHDAGYDIVDSLDYVLNMFDKINGLNKLHVVHINDSKNIRGAQKDRHENIGFGNIGYDALINVIYSPRLEHTIKILETPYLEGNPPYKEEIKMIKEKVFNPSLKDEILSK